MALADPQSLKFGSAAAISLPRTGLGMNTGTFTAPDGTAKVEVLHQNAKRLRARGRTEHSKIAADPLLAHNTRYGMSVYTVVDRPTVGYSIAEQVEIVNAHIVWLQSQVTKLLGGES